MANIEVLIPEAIRSIETCNIVNADGKIAGEFNGYISSFGASLIAGGLLPTIIFYSQKGESSGRNKIIEALGHIVKAHYPDLLEQNVSLTQKLVTMVRERQSTSRLEEKLMKAATALKLAIRTFPKLQTEAI